MVKISDECRQDILSDNYWTRYMACNRILKENGVSKEFYQLRRVLQLITSKSNEPTELEKANFSKALTELEKYIENYGKKIDLSKLSKEELNELFLDECYNTTDLTHKKVVEFFENGADINYKDKENLNSFFLASRYENVDINREFLKRGADVNEPLTAGSKNTVWTNYYSTNYETLKLFIEYGANLDHIGDNGCGVLHNLTKCTEEKFHQNVKLLIDSGANVNLKNNQGQTALFIACANGCVEYINLFAEKGCDINLVDNQGNTPLIVAVKNNKKSSVEALLKLNANKDIKDSQGQTAYELSIKSGSSELACLFDAKNGENDIKNSENFQKVKELKEKIIQKMKNGGKYSNIDNEGVDEFFYENGTYIARYSEHQSDYTCESKYQDDESALKYLYKCLYNERLHKTELEAYEYILGSLSFV